MGSKFVIYFGIFLGGLVGSYVPALWHQGGFTAAGVIGGGIGSVLGLWIGYKIDQMIGG